MRDGFWQEAEERRARWNVVAHPFCDRWASGGLGSRELALYASEYDHAVVAIANASALAAGLGGGELAGHASGEEEHVSLWRRFARETGWGGWVAWAYGEEPLAETTACARIWEGDGRRGLADHLVTLWTVETTQAQVSARKLAALLDHYGFSDGPATEYYRLHAGSDVEHAELMRSRLDPLLGDADLAALLDRVEAAQRSYWQLLDGVEALAAR